MTRSSDKGNPLLYFAYSASIEPAHLAEVAPGAEFQFIAHLPEWILEWPIQNGSGGLPSVRPLPGNTVWGAVFSLEKDDLPGLDARESAEGRTRTEAQAMDREGRRHDVIVHVASKPNGEEYTPEHDYLALMVAGGRHWKLPTGWVASLEEHLEDF